MFRTLTLALYLLASLSIFAQYDNSAPKSLDNLAKAIKESEGIRIDFSISIEELGQDNVLDSDQGKLLLKDDAYVLSFNGTTTYCDGKSQWVYLEDEQEVTIQEMDEEEISAASIFTKYQEGFRFRTLKEDENSAVVELSPTDKGSPYLRVTMNINTVEQELLALVIQSRNAMLTEIKVDAWEKQSLSESDFSFNSEKHPEVEVIDLR